MPEPTSSVVVDPEIQQATDTLLASDPDLQEEDIIRSASSKEKKSGGQCPFAHSTSSQSQSQSQQPQSDENEALPYEFIPLAMGGRGGTHKVSEESKRLIEQEVKFEDLKRMTTIFYQLAFSDYTLDKFLRSKSDPHADRFAKWIHQKISGSELWDQDRESRNLEPVTVARGRQVIVRDRTAAHIAAWNSPKRPDEEVGRHFQLDECRVWMRLHFWAMRQAGLVQKSPSFADFYVRFIGHFVTVYEKRATKFARDSFRWSEDPKNIEAYIQGGRIMKDVLGVDHTEAKKTLPEEEVDYEWPYYQEAP